MVGLPSPVLVLHCRPSGTMTETQEAAVIKAAAKAACRDVEAEDESGSERVATASTSTSNEARRISAGLDLRSDEGVASARSPHSSDEATSPDQVPPEPVPFLFLAQSTVHLFNAHNCPLFGHNSGITTQPTVSPRPTKF